MERKLRRIDWGLAEFFHQCGDSFNLNVDIGFRVDVNMNDESMNFDVAE